MRVLYDYPELTFSTFKIEGSSLYNTTLGIWFEYPDDATKMQNYKDEWDEIYPEIFRSLILPDMADYEREFAVFEYIMDTVTPGLLWGLWQ